ncbi:hypothetical protein ZWY2020_021079 [Hordeum vulgare]|nr:hypothetical protein ZWY2020_021079 [Hordeum vulgare]
MVVHATRHHLEIMGLMRGKFRRLHHRHGRLGAPVEGTKPGQRQPTPHEYMVEYTTINKYHSHPGYGCWLSGIDVSTQMLNQQFQEPFLAVVIDPTRTVFAGKVDIGAFRTYPKDYKPPDEPVSEYQTIPLNKIEDFGVHFKQYYSLDITYFKSSLNSHLLDLLWNKYWVNTLSSSPLLGNRDYVVRQIFDLAVKKQAPDRFGILMPSQRKKEEVEIEYVEGDDIEMGDMDDMEDFEGFGDEDGLEIPF